MLVDRNGRRLCQISAILAATYLGFAASTFAAVEFSTSDPGQASSLDLWGIGWIGNTATSIERMGGEHNIDVVRIGSSSEWALDPNNNLDPNAIAEIDHEIAKAVLVQQGNPNVRYAQVGSGNSSIDPWYIQQNGLDLRGTRWLEMFRATRDHIEGTYGIDLAHVEVSNEHDFGGKIGRKDNIHSIQQRFQDDSEFADIPVIGPSTLSSGNAMSWYDVIKDSTDYAATHLINGSGQSYVNFLQQVEADGKPYYGSEIHHLVEMIIAEEYSGIGGSWWNTVTEIEGKFVQATEGNRIFYEERIGSTSAASGYRNPDDPSTIHIFAASANNGDGGETFDFSTDRPVYWNGVGPQQSFQVTIGATEEQYIEVVIPELTPVIRSLRSGERPALFGSQPPFYGVRHHPGNSHPPLHHHRHPPGRGRRSSQQHLCFGQCERLHRRVFDHRRHRIRHRSEPHDLHGHVQWHGRWRDRHTGAPLERGRVFQQFGQYDEHSH